jgi:adenylosuccinate synthase
MKAIAVIGAAFGDEGKGRLVDHFAAKAEAPAVVVRYNGGAQAGHTVVTPKGERHVFHHFGSGTFAGAHTYLSSNFIGNPLLFCTELEELLKKVPDLTVIVNPAMPISTPYDMLLNREIESHRGNNRHGSCGLGISETVERLIRGPALFFAQADDNDLMVNRILDIKNKWVPSRLKEAGIKPSDAFLTAWENKALFDEFSESIYKMRKLVNMESNAFLKRYKTIIFEGSQGLGLDSNHKYFPHVTRSHPGINNIQLICLNPGIKSVDVCYVTRAYTTRHGAGPFPTEDQSLSYPDQTNSENNWQGKLRFGCLDLDLIRENIQNDMAQSKIARTNSIAITCLDQIQGDEIKVKANDKTAIIKIQHLAELVKMVTGINRIITSKSNSRKKG